VTFIHCLDFLCFRKYKAYTRTQKKERKKINLLLNHRSIENNFEIAVGRQYTWKEKQKFLSSACESNIRENLPEVNCLS